MISIFDLEKAPAAELLTHSSSLGKIGSAMRTCADTVRDVASWDSGGCWSGDSADAASHRTQSTANRVDVTGVAAGTASTVSTVYGEVLEVLQEGASITLQLARGLGYQVGADGSVRLSPVQMAIATAAAAVPTTQQFAALIHQLAAVLQAILQGMLLAANTADSAASAALKGLIASLALTEEPSQTSTTNAATGSSTVTQPSGFIGPVAHNALQAPTGPVTTVGTVESADRVITLVSGVGSSSGDSLRKNTIWAEQQVRAAAARGEKLAVVAWHGYSAPPSLTAAVSPAQAKLAAPTLQKHQEKLREVNPAATLEVIGFSYGSAVVGEAAGSKDFQADTIELIGSPGTSLSPEALESSSSHGANTSSDGPGTAGLGSDSADGPTITAHRQLGDPIWLASAAEPLIPTQLKETIGLGPDPVPAGALNAWGKLMTGYLWAQGERNAHSSYLWDEGLIGVE